MLGRNVLPLLELYPLPDSLATPRSGPWRLLHDESRKERAFLGWDHAVIPNVGRPSISSRSLPGSVASELGIVHRRGLVTEQRHPLFRRRPATAQVGVWVAMKM